MWVLDAVAAVLFAGYRRGVYVTQNYAVALGWYQFAARQGYKNVRYWITLLNRDGEGAPRDVRSAYMWAVIASSDADPTALQLIPTLAKLLSDANKAEAERNAQRWLSMSQAKRAVSIFSLTGLAP